jgi:hypothetical protein
MTHDELFHMMATVLKPFGQQLNETWRKAFKLYNEAHERSLSMSCSVCYMKVLKYHEKETTDDN